MGLSTRIFFLSKDHRLRQKNNSKKYFNEPLKNKLKYQKQILTNTFFSSFKNNRRDFNFKLKLFNDFKF